MVTITTQAVIVGIDPGVNTGLATWCPKSRRLGGVQSMSAVRAMNAVLQLHQRGELLRVVFEDARLRQWFGTKGREALQGAGSIKRDCSMWQEFLEFHGIPYKAVSPQGKGAKFDAAAFERLTGWRERTNEHARDAAMLVYGIKS
jgi:hypothetical protein